VSPSVALVTGGASGVGLATTRLLVKDGWSVTAVDADRDAIEALRRELPDDRLIALAGDVRDEDLVANAVKRSLERFGRIDGLCTCAGIKRRGPLCEMERSTWQEVIDVNLTGTFLAVRHVMPVMAKAGSGRIVTVASPSAYAEKNAAAYAASKGAILALTRSLALEGLADHVAVNCVIPGVTRTPMVVYSEEQLVARGSSNVTGQVNTADDVARAIRYLLSPEAATVSGAILDVGHIEGAYAGA
jgi:NAD(P)-dependent dehydrogenase (short-subunit alcohol dehydrogenase family)